MEAKSGSVDELRTAIRQLVDSRKSKLATSGLGGEGGSKSETDLSIDGGGDYDMLSELLSQLQTLEGETSIKQLLTDKDEPLGAGNDNVENQEGTEKQSKIGTEEIIEEIKNVKRQNTITHWLLSGLLVITVVWQLSEISLILKMKDGLAHPFRSVGSILSGLIKRPSRNGENGEKQSSLAPMENLVEAPSLPVEIPHVELPGLGGSDDS